MLVGVSEVDRRFPTQPRVLVIEDEPKWCEIYEKNLRDWGYEPIIAQESKTVPHSERISSLVNDAIQKARGNRCHVALVDMRLKEDPRDISGLMLIHELVPTVSIVVSAHGDVSIVNEALSARQQVPFRPYAFIAKTEVQSKLKSIIDDVLRQYWPYLFSNVKVIDDSIKENLSRRFTPEEREELDALFRQTFSSASVLRLEALESSHRPQGLSLRSHSLVLQATPDHEVPVVIKVARSARVAEEQKNYALFVSRFFAGRFYGRHVRSESMWSWGCALYEFLGNLGQNMRLFADFYVQESPKRICDALERLGDNLNGLYSRTHQLSNMSLFATYKEAWGDEWCHGLLSWRVNFPVPTIFSTWGLPDPIEWTRQKIDVLKSGGRDATNTLPWPDKAVIHGDLHGENLFVDNDGNIWVIDYERAHYGPILQDWAELENDILTRLISLNAVDLAAYADFIPYFCANSDGLYSKTPVCGLTMQTGDISNRL